MSDFGAAIGLVLAIEEPPMAGLAGSRRTRIAIVAPENPAKLRGVGLGAARQGIVIVGVFRSLLQARFPGEVTSRRTDRGM